MLVVPIQAQQYTTAKALTLTVYAGTIVINWTASVTSGVTGYNIYRGSVPGGEGLTPINGTPINAVTFTDTKRLPGKNCYYLTSVTASKESLPSNESCTQ